MDNGGCVAGIVLPMPDVVSFVMLLVLAGPSRFPKYLYERPPLTGYQAGAGSGHHLLAIYPQALMLALLFHPIEAQDENDLVYISPGWQ